MCHKASPPAAGRTAHISADFDYPDFKETFKILRAAGFDVIACGVEGYIEPRVTFDEDHYHVYRGIEGVRAFIASL